ncbi:HAD family hydrolase [Desulfomonile tiedjei]|uniref:phosphoglycolate phosphatase n=1 Tax=Desulfomonile tiedjei (strain ATCC 49306 / DSM 6799 / DCB-1) TaxID=706587 RepID=I4C629_DESTA|nr:HAD family hydrolase [Desulfomonile tiedjei]AFM25020.1 putative phosphatase [Desulfomonile tiedjei DSM 6799]
MKKLILFDIDGTLMDSGGAGIAALNLALQDLTGIREGFRGIDCAGKTDIQIVLEAYAKWGVVSGDGMVRAFVDRYLHHLPEQVTMRNGGNVKKGVHDLLAALSRVSDYALGLLTGNVEKGARVKLAPHRLNDYFPLGAFGDDSADRNELLPIALRRFGRVNARPVDAKACLVIGDTPRDVECAHVHSAPCLAVATGRYSTPELVAAGADLALDDLSDTTRILDWIDGLGTTRTP